MIQPYIVIADTLINLDVSKCLGGTLTERWREKLQHSAMGCSFFSQSKK